MTPEKLAQFEKCYRNWNGTSVMLGAFAELLAEVHDLRKRVDRWEPKMNVTSALSINAQKMV